MDGIHDHLMGDYDYELGPGLDDEHRNDRDHVTYRTSRRSVETPGLPVVGGTFRVVETPSRERRSVGGDTVQVLNLVVAAEPYQHHRTDGRVESIESPPLTVAVWGADGTHLHRHLTEGSVVAVSGFLRVASFRRTASDPAIEVYRPKVLIVARRERLDAQPVRPLRHSARTTYRDEVGCHPYDDMCGTGDPCRNHGGVVPLPAASRLDGYFDDDEARDDVLPARSRDESESSWMSRCEKAGWYYDRENDTPFSSGPTDAGFSRDTRGFGMHG